VPKRAAPTTPRNRWSASANRQGALYALTTKLGELNAQRLDQGRQKRELERDIEVIDNELNKLRGGFGVDQQVKAQREELRDVRGRSGIFGRFRYLRVARGYEFTLKNNRPAHASLTVIDQVPVSRNEDLKVSVARSTAPPTKKTGDGLLRWKLPLKSAKERTFQFGYEVEYPRSMHLVGLE